MGEPSKAHGHIVWTDISVRDAERLSDFYAAVVGWQPDPVEMGGYSDFNMNDASGAPVAGVCHARGVNAQLPPVWLIYLSVANLDQSIRRCKELGGEVLDGPRGLGESRFCVIRDPAGAIAALIQSGG